MVVCQEPSTEVFVQPGIQRFVSPQALQEKLGLQPWALISGWSLEMQPEATHHEPQPKALTDSAGAPEAQNP